MIQFFINSRPVPRALARYHLAEANPSRSLEDLSRCMSQAVSNDAAAVKFLEVYGVEVRKL